MTTRDLGLLLRTVRHLRFKQIYHQVFFKVTKSLTGARGNTLGDLPPGIFSLRLLPSIPSVRSYSDNAFTFLNRTKTFQGQIDWSYQDFGMLWAYNLNYFDFLMQDGLNPSTGLDLIHKWCENRADNKVGTDPYPISVRGINWIKFLTQHNISDKKCDTVLYADYRRLASRPEYHLLGNHLLENAYSLLFASHYFKHEGFYGLASQLLREELREQVTSDGGHFELSPMYHRILLFRLLDCINLLMNNRWKKDDLESYLRERATLMLSWLETVTFRNGETPMVNDSAPGIAPSTRELQDYAGRLGLVARTTQLSDSGYRMIRTDRTELFIDVGKIGPDYIPGHAHSDTFNFIFHVDGVPVISETGTSTYDIGERRLTERSTSSHNTVIVNDKDQSEVWASFRVGNRARIVELREMDHSIRSTHDGYRNLGILHSRTWTWTSQTLQITDELSGGRDTDHAVASLHFQPGINPQLAGNHINAGPLQITIGSPGVIEDYEFADGFNRIKNGKVLRVPFSVKLEMRIQW